MKRNAFLMRLKPGCEAEYRLRHNAIWPELKRELRAAGISDYSIYLERTTGHLFAVQKLASDHTANRLPETEVVQRWWQSMRDLMETHPDGSPCCAPLEEVFHLD